MITSIFSFSSSRQRGFSLVELMVAIAILSVILAAIAGVFARTSRLYTTQNASAALQQEVRAAVEVMARELRMAGYDPLKTGDFKLEVTDATRIRFSTDLNANGKLDDGNDPPTTPSSPAFPNCEKLSFRYSAATDAAQIICGEGTGSPDTQTLIGNTDTRVTNLAFRYLGSSGTVTSVKNAIRAVEITLIARAPAGAEGMIERSYSTRVELRNSAGNSIL